MARWLNGKYRMKEEFAEKGLSYVDEFGLPIKAKECNNNLRSKKVYCGGYIFNSITECAEYYEINRSTMYSWLNGYRKIPDEFIEKGLKYI